MLAESVNRYPSICSGRDISLEIRSTTRSISSRLATCGSTIANFVAAQPADVLAAPQRRAQALRELGEDEIAGGVAHRVVDRLEAVDVDEEHSGPQVVALGGGEDLLDTREDRRSVRQAGQLVRIRQLTHLRVGAAPRMTSLASAVDEAGPDSGDLQR